MLEQIGVVYKTKKLKCADYNWLWRCEGVERQLPFFVERKRADDVAFSLKDGRFWTQIANMTTKKAEFAEKGLVATLQYIFEGKADKFVTRCADGCQGVGRCGNPTPIQVQHVLKDLEQHPDLELLQMGSLRDTVRHLACVSLQLKHRTGRGEFDAPVLAEIVEQSLPISDNSHSAQTFTTDNHHLKKLKIEEPVVMIDDNEGNASSVSDRKHICTNLHDLHFLPGNSHLDSVEVETEIRDDIDPAFDIDNENDNDFFNRDNPTIDFCKGTAKSTFSNNENGWVRLDNSSSLSGNTVLDSPPSLFPVLRRRGAGKSGSAGRSEDRESVSTIARLLTSSGSPRGRVYLMKRRESPVTVREPPRPAESRGASSPCSISLDSSSTRGSKATFPRKTVVAAASVALLSTRRELDLEVFTSENW